jgi:hypothetical protein
MVCSCVAGGMRVYSRPTSTGANCEDASCLAGLAVTVIRAALRGCVSCCDVAFLLLFALQIMRYICVA